MELPIGNFFQVSINSNKLYSFMEDIMKKIDHQELRQAQLSKNISNLNKNIDERLSNLHHSMLIQMQKVKKINQEDTNFVKLYLKDVDKKLSDKMVELQGGVAQLSKKINQTRESMEEDLSIKLSYLQKKILNSTALQQMQARFKSQTTKLNENLSKIQETSKIAQQNLQANLKKHIQMNQSLIQKFNLTESSRKAQIQNWSLNTSFKDVDSPSKSHIKRGQRKKDTLFHQLQGLGNNIDLKIDQLQSKLDKNHTNNQPRARRSIISNNKIVKYNEHGSKKVIKKSNIKSQNILRQLQGNLLEKLNKIQELSINKLSTFQKELVKQNNKSQIIDQHIGILSRKIEKEKVRINQVTDTVKTANDKKVDEKVIENIKNIIKKMSKDFQEAIQLRLTRDIYEKQRGRTFEKIESLIDLINEKAEKSQVRKGLGFLQQKLKEVIIVIAEQKTGNQDGAIKRTPFKCLSCDKDLQIDKFQPIGLIKNKENSSSNIRCNATQMRKRIRLINNTVTTANLDD